MAPIKSINGSWIDLNSNDIVNLTENWQVGEPNGPLESCTVFALKSGQLLDTPCLSESCFICAWINKPLFTLRGLCSNSKIDHQYVLLPELVYNDRMFFWGFGENNIIFSQEKHSWLIIEDEAVDIIKLKKKPSKIVGSFQPNEISNQMPIGRQIWNLTSGQCKGLVPLKLTGVSVL